MFTDAHTSARISDPEFTLMHGILVSCELGILRIGSRRNKLDFPPKKISVASSNHCECPLYDDASVVFPSAIDGHGVACYFHCSLLMADGAPR